MKNMDSGTHSMETLYDDSEYPDDDVNRRKEPTRFQIKLGSFKAIVSMIALLALLVFLVKSHLTSKKLGKMTRKYINRPIPLVELSQA